MKLDLTIMKNESILRFQKYCAKTQDHFHEMLSIALDAAVYEIDKDKRQQVETELMDLFNDEFNKYKMTYTNCINKAARLVEEGLL